MNDSQELQFSKDFEKFVESGFLFKAKDAKGQYSLAAAIEKLRYWTSLYVDKNNGGLSSQSAFGIIANALVEKGELVPIKEAPEVPELTVAQYRAMPVRQIQLKFGRDPVFKAQVEKLIADGKI